MHIRYFLFEMKAERGGRPGGDDAGDDVERQLRSDWLVLRRGTGGTAERLGLPAGCASV